MPSHPVRDPVALPAAAPGGTVPTAAPLRVFGGLPLYVALLALTAYALRFGYHYGTGDHDALIPSLLHLLDADLFARDWLVQTLTSGVGTQTYFLWLMALPSLVFPPMLAVALLWVGTFVVLSFGVYGLAHELTGDRLAASLSVPLALVGTGGWTLGPHVMAYDTLLPAGAAWAFAVPAVTLFFQRRWTMAAALLGIAAWFDLPIGTQATLVVGLAGLVRAGLNADLEARQLRADLDDLARFGGVFALAALPILLPTAFGPLATGAPVEAAPPPAAIRAWLQPSLFGAGIGDQFAFWSLFAVGGAAGRGLSRRGMLQHGDLITISGVLVTLACLGAVVLGPAPLVAKLHLFALTPLVALAASILITAFAVVLLPAALQQLGTRLLGRRWAGLAISIGLVVLVVGGSVRSEGGTGALLFPVQHARTSLGAVEAWAQEETASDALFAVPPSVRTFRTYARRAVVANETGLRLPDRDLQRWFVRLMDVAPAQAGAADAASALDTAYHARTASDWQQLRRGYGVGYAILRREAARLPFDVAFANEGWTVYRLGPEDTP